MTSQADIDCFFGNGGEALVREAVSFVFGRDNWARSLVGANSGWNERTRPAGVVAEQWFFPFNPRMVVELEAKPRWTNGRVVSS